MTPETRLNDPVLEQALSEIRNDAVDPAVVEAAAARVWAKISVAAAEPHHGDHIRTCADFQALIPDFRAGRLPQARALLVKDHLHECVACRRVYEGRVVTMSEPRRAVRRAPVGRWVLAAAAVLTVGVSVWIAVDSRTGAGRAIVQTVNGSLFEVSADGIRPLAVNQELPDGIEVRTAKNSDAMLKLRDGSVVELRERSGFNTSHSASDLTVHLLNGSIIVQAAKRSSGHLYVDTADCRVAVTGTVFGVSTGVKGSRVSVIQGEVHVTHENEETVLHPGDQTVTNPGVEPQPIREDIAWSRNRDRYYALLASLRAEISRLHLPDLRYSSSLIDRLPADTVFFASIPNLSQYLGDAESAFRQRMSSSPELGGLLSGKSAEVLPVLDKLRAGSAYLGDEVVIAGAAGPEGQLAPVLLAEIKQPGFPEFLKQAGIPLAIESRNNLVVFGPMRAAVEHMSSVLDNPNGGFKGTPFYARIEQEYHAGAGLLLCADLSRFGNSHAPVQGVRYVIAEQKEINHQMEARATVSFDGSGSGASDWLAEPAPMGSLDYVSADATVVAAFLAKNPGGAIDALAKLVKTSKADFGPAGDEIRTNVGASLGGEFTIAMDGPAFPVPSWKLVAEVYDPGKLQAAIQKAVEAYNQLAVQSGDKPLRTAQETVDGRTIYMIAGGNPNPLTEAHYTFSGGYLIAGPTRAIITRALQVKAGAASIKHAGKFLALAPHDPHVNFSAVFFENLGTTLAPLAGLAGALMPNMTPEQQKGLQKLGNIKPTLLAAYGEPDGITVASADNVLGSGLTDLMTGNIGGLVGNAIPFNAFSDAGRRRPAYSREH